jgi:host factor-I protein
MNNKPVQNLQDAFLNYLRKEKIPATVFTTNGYQIKNALIKGFDSFVMIIESDNKQTMIYKHAVSSVAPSAVLNLNAVFHKEDEEQ